MKLVIAWTCGISQIIAMMFLELIENLASDGYCWLRRREEKNSQIVTEWIRSRAQKGAE